MGLLSKIFGCGKMDLTDESKDVENDQKQEQNDEKTGDDGQNKTTSPFLMDDEDIKNE